MAVTTYIDAINSALREEMELDDSVFIIGEDVGKMGVHSRRPRVCWRSLDRNG